MDNSIVKVDSSKISVVSLNVGESGSGKTHLSCTYPKCYIIFTEPNSHWTFMMKPELKKNIVKYEYFLPDPDDEERTLKSMYGTPIANTILIKAIKEAKEMYKKGEVETLVIDNASFLVLNKWQHICKFEQQFSKQGELNKMAMFSVLRDWLYEFFLSYVVNFRGNVVVTSHQMRESDEVMENKVDKTMDLVPNIMGGFRNDIYGLFSNVFYLSKEQDGKGGYKYYARTDKGQGRFAKNRFGLPPVIENPSYQLIEKAIQDSINKKEVK